MKIPNKDKIRRTNDIIKEMNRRADPYELHRAREQAEYEKRQAGYEAERRKRFTIPDWQPEEDEDTKLGRRYFNPGIKRKNETTEQWAVRFVTATNIMFADRGSRLARRVIKSSLPGELKLAIYNYIKSLGGPPFPRDTFGAEYPKQFKAQFQGGRNEQ